MSKTWLYPDRQTHAVACRNEDDGKIYDGTLSYGGGRWARLAFKSDAPTFLVEGEEIDHVEVQSELGKKFTLCECRLSGLDLYANFVIEGSVAPSAFDQITVRLHEVSEWFLREQRVEGRVGGHLAWSEKSKPIVVSVANDDERFTLTSEYHGSIRQSGENRVISEYVDFRFTTEGKKFDLQDLKRKTHELACLLSILMAYPATIGDVRIRQHDGGHSRVHFVTSGRLERDFDDSGFWTKFFVQKQQLDDRWQTIFERYYRSRFRKVCWTRLAGMQRYEGFWEYEALGYVSLLDRYVSIFSEGSPKPEPVPPTETKLAEFRRLVKVAMPSVEGAKLDTLVDVASRAFASTSFAFGEKYELAKGQTDSDIVRIIALSDTAFRKIKRIRDAIAHANDPKLSEGDHTLVSEIVEKIKLLLTYWAFIDFGLTKYDFLECLKATRSEVRFIARLDELHLARLTGTATFLSVSRANLDELKSTKGTRSFGCFIREGDGSISFSDLHTKMYSEWQNSRDGNTPMVLSANAIFGIEDAGASAIPHAYLESGEERFEIFHLWLIERAAINE
ncbi:ApeA_NTD1 domain-containing protein [Paraburkholderia tropica]|uniref:ApeA N-terminal domain 1-containing protein n=1 Tax=Paraburkholderia tropica TaxID=92647 RepID=UPI001CAAEBE2|nr:HEPN domain-containing protein [Paraburkholderia tropica]CAG9217798.1 ApeA_NTD1 domain-containing protein [Paraburkholderia tropica]